MNMKRGSEKDALTQLQKFFSNKSFYNIIRKREKRLMEGRDEKLTVELF